VNARQIYHFCACFQRRKHAGNVLLFLNTVFAVMFASYDYVPLGAYSRIWRTKKPALSRFSSVTASVRKTRAYYPQSKISSPSSSSVAIFQVCERAVSSAA
jgi:hypothetical protein